MSRLKKVSVIVKDKYTLILDESAQKGDYIDLSNLTSIDFKYIESLIANGKDDVYNRKFEDYTKELEEKYKLKQENEIRKLEYQYETKLKEINNHYNLDKNNLEYELKDLKSTFEAKMDVQKNKLAYEHQTEKNNLEKSYLEKINLLELENNKLKESVDLQLSNLENRLSNEFLKKIEEYKNTVNLLNLEKEKLKNINDNLEANIAEKLKLKELEINQIKNQEINDIKDKFNKTIFEKEEIINNLKRQKSALNIKQTGENLEAWCDNEMKSYRQVGLFNTTWNKDNDVIREDDEVKGSKADYIFRIFESQNLKTELASVCLDMKDENPDSSKKQSNEHYYKALDKNRLKKKCKYAVLVSNLETDRPNDLPIWKVNEYEDMYVVRPGYMMTFLNMLNSLTLKFANIILSEEKEQMQLLSYNTMIEQFESLKNTYLDKPLEALKKNIENIRTQNEGLRKISYNIDNECSKIINSYICGIEEKLNKFNIKLEGAYKKINK